MRLYRYPISVIIRQEVKVGNQSTLAIQLVEDTQALSEVVVVGYGVQRKVTTTGAVTKAGR